MTKIAIEIPRRFRRGSTPSNCFATRRSGPRLTHDSSWLKMFVRSSTTWPGRKLTPVLSMRPTYRWLREGPVAARAPEGDYGPILYPLAVIRDSANANAAKGFVDLVLSPEGIQILKKNGFQPAK